MSSTETIMMQALNIQQGRIQMIDKKIETIANISQMKSDELSKKMDSILKAVSKQDDKKDENKAETED
jgi:hypothetical protein